MTDVARFRKRAVEVEAAQFQPFDNQSRLSLLQWLDSNGATYLVEGNELTIRTLEDGHDGRAKHVASPGDWIIKGIAGEFYPCRDDIFRATYELVNT